MVVSNNISKPRPYAVWLFCVLKTVIYHEAINETQSDDVDGGFDYARRDANG